MLVQPCKKVVEYYEKINQKRTTTIEQKVNNQQQIMEMYKNAPKYIDKYIGSATILKNKCPVKDKAKIKVIDNELYSSNNSYIFTEDEEDIKVEIEVNHKKKFISDGEIASDDELASDNDDLASNISIYEYQDDNDKFVSEDEFSMNNERIKVV